MTGEKALGWVRERNAESAEGAAETGRLRPAREAPPRRSSTRTRASRTSTKHGACYYNFWRDAKNPRGLWRRTTLDEYRKAEPEWEMVLDLDALGAEEKENWVWHGAELPEAGLRALPRRALARRRRRRR